MLETVQELGQEKESDLPKVRCDQRTNYHQDLGSGYAESGDETSESLMRTQQSAPIAITEVVLPNGHFLLYRFSLDRLDILIDTLCRHAIGGDVGNPYHRLSFRAAVLVIQEARRMATRWLMS